MTLLEGYIANWNKYPKDEIKIRVARPHLLSPSKELLDRYKDGRFSFRRYKQFFINEMFVNSEAMKEIAYISELSCYIDVRLICYEKNPEQCHRSILMEFMEKEYV